MKEKMNLSDLWGGCIWSSSKPQTNYDRIISKTPEELAVWMNGIIKERYIEVTCDGWLSWLKAPAEEGEE